MPSGLFLFRGLILILALAPLPFGSVGLRASAILVAACLLLGIPWVVWRSRRGLPVLPWREPLLLWGALFLAYGAAQIVPLPRGVLEVVSPRAVDIRDRYEPPPASAPGFPCEGREPTGWRPISMYPWATRQSLLRFAAYLVAALIAIDIAVLEGGARRLAAALVACGSFQAIYGLAEFASGRQQIFGYARKHFTDVATGTFINRNHFAGYLEISLPLALALATIAFPRGGAGAGFRRRLGQAAGRDLFVSGLLLLAALTMAAAILSSRSRMGIASALIALACVALFAARRGHGRGLAIAALVAGGGALILYGQGEGGAGFERFHLAGSDITAGRGRLSIWSQAAGVVEAFPLFGAGLGAFESVFAAFRTEGEGISLAHAHNDYLQLAAETGAAGCALFALGFLCVAGPLMRRRGARPDHGPLGAAAAAGVVAIGIHSIADFNLAIPATAVTFSVLVGMVISWRGRTAPVLAVDGERRARWAARAWGPAALLAVLAAVALAPAAAGPPARGNGDPRTVQGGAGGPPAFRRTGPLVWFQDADNEERLHGAAAATGRAEVEDLQALIEASDRGAEPSAEAADYVRRRLMAAGAIQATALRHQPTSSRGHLMMGHICAGLCAAEALLGAAGADCLDPALEEFRAAVRLAPVSASSHLQAARFYLRAWPAIGGARREEAAAVIDRAVSMSPGETALAAEWARIRGTPEVGRE